MKKARLKRLLAPLGLATVWLALILGAMWLFSHANDALAAPHRDAVVPLQADDAPNISNIAGAIYDEARGEIIVFGIADPDLPSLDFPYLRENLAVALRAFYDSSSPDIPGVSIEGTLDPLDVIYFGGVTNTHFGQVSFESDRLLKIYTLGVDNLTGLTVTSKVTGYMSFPDRMQQLTETVEDPIVIRYFFTPTLLIEPITSPHTILFSQTQKFIDWAYMSAATSSATAEAAQGFVDNFNQYYLDYAAERRANYGDTTLYEMAQLSKLTAIAQWAHDQGLELKLPGLNDPWLDHYPVSYTTTVTQTPGITVTWVQTIAGTPYELSLRGGVYAIGDIVWLPPTAEGQELADAVHKGAQPPSPPPMIYQVRPTLNRPFLDEPYQTEGPLVAYVVPLADNAVINGDFEDGPGSAPWGQDSFFDMITDFSSHNGTYAAQFPLYQDARVALSQTLYVPADATMARLTYWRAAATAETTHPHDFFASFLADAAGAPLTTFETLNDGDADGYWHQVSFDVVSYTGQMVQLWFTATTDGSNITNFYVDDVSLDYLDPTPPTVIAVTHTPHPVPLSDTVEFVITFHERMNAAVAPTVTIRPQGSPISYMLVPKTGSGYTNGYLDSNPTQWHGLYTFTLQMPEDTYSLDVAAAQDLADNVMYTAENAYTFSFNAIPPQVEGTFPAAGASGVPLNADIVITFSEAINTSTFAYTVSPDPGGWAESWDSGSKAVTLAHDDFAPGTTCTVTVTQARDLAGNSLSSAPVIWSFTTATAPDTTQPQLESHSPANGAQNVPLNASVVIAFSEAINPATFAYTVSPNPGGWASSWDAVEKKATLTHNDFAANATYTVTVIQAKDLAGNSLSGAPLSWWFTTSAAPDLTPPQVQSTFPADGASGVPVDASIVITFNEEMNISTFGYTASPDPGSWVESWDSKNEVVTLAQDAFEPGTTFTITVIQARDLAGNSLSGGSYAWSFKTAYTVYLPAILK